ncbi:MAG TPA: TetR/AcrR family transcriptional regulator, partial [Terriglobia bacterium]|nr:TetR/AcrR family transcriptional regulator [Terriglobia bacterium]
GISRATFFNYFPQKELILREVAAARVERLKGIIAEYAAGGHAPTLDGIVGLILKLCEENARITRHSKKILLETLFRQASQGLMLGAREKAIQALAKVIARVPRRRGVSAEVVAETLFAVYIATMLEWLMREGVPDKWLMVTMRKRLRLAWEGAA